MSRRLVFACLVCALGCDSSSSGGDGPLVDASFDAGTNTMDDAAAAQPIDASNGPTVEPDAGNDSSVEPDAGNGAGAFAIKTVVDVWWQDDLDPPRVDPGRGAVTFFHKVRVADACDDNTVQQIEIEPCGFELPALVSWAACSAYQVRAADALWSSPDAPAWSASGDLEHAGQTSIALELGSLGEVYKPSGCGINGASPIEFRGMPLSSNVNALCDPATNCPGTVVLTATVHAQLEVSDLPELCLAHSGAFTRSMPNSAIDVSVTGCKLEDDAACSEAEVSYVDGQLPTLNVLESGEAPPESVLANPCECSGGCLGEPCALKPGPSVGTRSAIVWLGDDGADMDCAAVRDAVNAQYPSTSF